MPSTKHARVPPLCTTYCLSLSWSKQATLVMKNQSYNWTSLLSHFNQPLSWERDRPDTNALCLSMSWSGDFPLRQRVYDCHSRWFNRLTATTAAQSINCSQPGDSAAWSLPSPGGVSVPANARLVTQHASWLSDLGMLHHLCAQADISTIPISRTAANTERWGRCHRLEISYRISRLKRIHLTW